MTYYKFSFDNSKYLPPFDELKAEVRTAFVMQYFRPANVRVAQAVLDDEAAIRIIREAYRALQRDPTQRPQQGFIDRLEVRIRILAEEERRPSSRYYPGYR